MYFLLVAKSVADLPADFRSLEREILLAATGGVGSTRVYRILEVGRGGTET